MRTRHLVLLVTCISATFRSMAAAPLPIREVTVFKDGHAVVTHEGLVQLNTDSEVVIDEVPRPVFGTFWAFTVESNLTVKSVKAEASMRSESRLALDLPELIRANPGAKVMVTEDDGQPGYEATIEGVPERLLEPPDAFPVDEPAPALAPAQIVALRTGKGLKIVQMNKIRDITFVNTPSMAIMEKHHDHALRLTFDQGRRRQAVRQVRAGYAYVQKGVRWVPGYRVILDDDKEAKLVLQATIVNDLADLNDATLHLVVGVPTFRFQDVADPLAPLLQAPSQIVSQQRPSYTPSSFAYTLSNAGGSQVAWNGPVSAPAPTTSSASDLAGTGGQEDLFVFTVPHVTLAKGERQLITLRSFTVPYADVYTLVVPFSPPKNAYRNFSNRPRTDIEKLMRRPKVTHAIRLENTSAFPLTTAPALIIKDGNVLAQSLCFYTPRGAKVDLALTTAINVRVKMTESITKETNGHPINDSTYTKVEVAGTIAVANHIGHDIRLEVKRAIFGYPESASGGGEIQSLPTMEGFEDLVSFDADTPAWWDWWWPWWWYRANQLGLATWNLDLASGNDAELTYSYYYFWQ